MMIVGGAVMPAIQGAIVDLAGVRLSLAIVLVGYLYLVYCGFFGSRENARVKGVSAEATH